MNETQSYSFGMKTTQKLLFAVLLSMGVSLRAATYSGNGNSGFGGPIGLGSLTLTDNGTTVSGTVNKGPNGFNDVLVLYIDSTAGGFSDTSGFADGADGLRKAISGFDGGANSLNFVASVNLNPTGTPNSPTYTFSFNVSQIGMTPNSGQTFSLLGTYTSGSGFRSDEAVAGNDVGSQGWNPFLGI